MGGLNWPAETARPATRDTPRFIQRCSNISLDFHGDPVRAKLVVFSDGNHHMALQEVLLAFVQANPEVDDVFYTTTPPSVALQMLCAGCLDLGNLRLTISPNVFIGPPAVLDRLVAEGRMHSHQAFASGRGIALLVRKGNPRRITGVESLSRADVRLFISNPDSEKVSHGIYVNCLRRLASQQGVAADHLALSPGRTDACQIIYGEAIHHREAPQAIADGHADTAVVFYHLALRYQRIFPDVFEFVPLRDPSGAPCDTGSTHCGLVDGGGEWGARLCQFLLGETTAKIYDKHGLDPATTTQPPAP
ncbi:MAG: molybdate ABC transporter substrate-binding protein [Thiobacillus sp.]